MPDPKSASDEAIVLEQYLQRQLEEDIARIFDESIYSDFEVVCGKSKILTHSCILKARTNQFYHKLKAILHVNIDRNIFEEIYSYISDAYTECDIKNQESEILEYLKSKLKIYKKSDIVCTRKETIDPDVFATPKCTSPFYENKLEQNLCQTPSKEIPKEYYALVPIDGYLLEKELSEQDELSNAFHSMIQTQNKSVKKVAHRKQLSLSLSSSHTLNGNISDYERSNTKIYCKFIKQQDTLQSIESNTSQKFSTDIYDIKTDKNFVTTYSPDSLIADDPSSSSDYLSATHTCSPGLGPIADFFPVNVEEHIVKMENVFTSSDSGFENTGMVESLNSNKDITLTDLSLIETSQTHDTSSNFINEPSWSLDATDENCVHRNNFRKNFNDIPFSKSSKDEKQRLNEEIVILESSSVSSETGSWESVFPPKIADKDICEKFITNERMYSNQNDVKSKPPIKNCDFEISRIKPSCCFIDAASLADEENGSNNLHLHLQSKTTVEQGNSDVKSLPCLTGNKLDISPLDLSESCDNEDSLEQGNNKDAEDTQKDLSPTIFEMTMNSEDPLNETHDEIHLKPKNDCLSSNRSSLVYVTPTNSILSVRTSMNYESSERIDDEVLLNKECTTAKKSRFNESSPIVSGGASVMDSLKSECQTGSPISRRKIDNIPIVTGVSVEEYKTPDIVPQKYTKPSAPPAWVIDMSSCSKSEDGDSSNSKTCNNLQSNIKSGNNSENCPKSRSSVESDNSEKTSHTYYIDFSIPDQTNQGESNSNEGVSVKNALEKKNIFSMYFNLDETISPKTKPRRLLTHNKRKSSVSESKDSVFLNTSDKTSQTSLVSNRISIKDFGADKNAFETYETLCNDLNISINEIISIPQNDSKIIDVSDTSIDYMTPRTSDTTTIPEEVEESDIFVKLSDLDKPIQKSDSSCEIESKNNFDDRMTRSIPENNWSEINTLASKSSEIVNSFHSENALSLNRLFPHLKNELSKSMPLSFSGRNQFRPGIASTNGERESVNSDGSEMSSVQSSMLCSVIENSTTEDTSQSTNIIGSIQSRLGKDLLRMFLEEIATDVVIEVSARRINAHKCILSSRCQYFAGILSGGWVESAGNVITLPPFSYNVVHFALCHIYSGISTIPDSISIVELATIADMLGLEGLKEAIMYTLKSKYCHHFHTPCQVCVVGVLECFPLSSLYGLDDLYRKCLKWITNNFTVVWPTKAFAILPKELLEKCYQEHLVHMKIESVIDTMCGCGTVVSTLQHSRWAEIVQSLCRKLVNSTAHFVAKHLLAVFKTIANFTSDISDSEKNALCDCIAAAIEWASPEETCRTYDYLSTILNEIREMDNIVTYFKENRKGEKRRMESPNRLMFANASMWHIQCERALVRAGPRVVGTQAFKDLPFDLRKRLRELGCIMYGPQALPVTPHSERKSSKSNRQCVASRACDMEKVRNSFVPYKSKPFPILGSTNDLKLDDGENKRYSPKVLPKVKTTKAQEERAKFNQCKQQSLLNDKRTKSTNVYQNAKPRYLETKSTREKNVTSNQLKDVILISSSESSRNSSPVKSDRKVKHLARRAVCAKSQDSIASRPQTAEPSTESQSESTTNNKYATYTKTKHADGSIEGTSSNCMRKVCSKSKIPVYLKQNSLPDNGINKTKEQSPRHFSAENSNVKNNTQEQTTSRSIALQNSSPSTSGDATNKNTSNKISMPSTNNVSRSLMNATKSSSAKMVSKPVKKNQSKKSSIQSKQFTRSTQPQKSQTQSKQSSHSTSSQENIRSYQNHSSKNTNDTTNEQNEVNIEFKKALERSSTFSKDEPMFLTPTNNIDDQEE